MDWDARFVEALAFLCGKTPPMDLVKGWLAQGQDERLQEWVNETKLIQWSDGIYIMDAAYVLADQDDAEL